MIYILSMWLDRLRAIGHRAELTEGGRTLLVGETVFRVVRRSRIRPSEIPPVDPQAVLWIPSASPATTLALTKTGWSWVTDTGFVHLHLDGHTIAVAPSEPERDGAQVTNPTARTPAELAVLGHLLEHPGSHRQQTMADATGLTQARVSQVLKRATTEQLAVRAPGGWTAGDLDRLFTVCSLQPEPSALVEHWYHLETAPRQIDLCLAVADAVLARARVSGDWAADRLAPWRLPTLAVVHADRTLDLEPAGFVPAGPADAMLVTVIHPISDAWGLDPAVLRRLQTESPWPFAPVHQIARDILSAGGSDAAEALDHLRTRFLDARRTESR